MQNKNKLVTVYFTFPSKSSETNDVSLCASYRNVLFFPYHCLLFAYINWHCRKCCSLIGYAAQYPFLASKYHNDARLQTK